MQTFNPMVSKHMPEYQQYMRFRILSVCLLAWILIMAASISLGDGDISYVTASDYSSKIDEYAPVLYVIVEDKLIFVLDIDPVK